MLVHWTIGSAGNAESLAEQRYCHGCKAVATFRPSGKVRRNANGRSVYHYAIYKCENDHTWNKFLGEFPPSENPSHFGYEFAEEFGHDFKAPESPSDTKPLDVQALSMQGTKSIEVLVDSVEGKHRLDRVLADRLSGISRRSIQSGIKRGAITVNSKEVKPGNIVKSGDNINLDLGSLRDQ